jgi:predicted dehydrogenase
MNSQTSPPVAVVEADARLGFDLPPHRPPYETMRLDGGVGVVGLHWVMLIMHLPAYAAARYNIRAAVDRVPERVREATAAHLPLGDIAASWEDVVDRDDVAVVDCCFGARRDGMQRRLQVAQRCATAGKALMVHKPPAMRLGDVTAMADFARDAGLTLAVNQNCRYNPANYAVKGLLHESRAGRPITIELQSYWRSNVKSRSDRLATVGHTIHHADLIRWWVDRPCVSVYARATTESTLATYEFDDGTIAYHQENHTGPETHRVNAHLQCENAVIRHGHNWNWHLPSAQAHEFVHVWRDTRAEPVKLDLPTHVYEPVWSRHNPYLPLDGPFYDVAGPIAGMMGSLGTLLHATATDTEPDNAIRHSIDSFRICLAAQISARTGKPVDPRQLPDDATAEN